MSGGLSQTLNIATSSLMFSQTAMNVISNNISNTNTTGYSRQVIEAGTITADDMGGGVTVLGVKRSTDSTINAQLVSQTSASSYADVTSSTMNNLQAVFGTVDSGTGIDTVLSDFFTELNNLSSNTNSSAERTNVVLQATNVATALNQMYAQTTNLQTQVNNQISDDLSVVNAALQRINQYNKQIIAVNVTKTGAQNTNDLQDARQQDINTVAKYLNINVTNNADGSVNIVSQTGQSLATATGYAVMQRTPASPPAYAGIGYKTVQADKTSNNVFPINTDQLTGGEIKALVDIRDTKIPALQDQLNNFASQFVTQMNQVHSQGVGLPPSSTLDGANLDISGADVVSELGLTAGSTFQVSVVDPSTGAVVNNATVTVPASASATAFAGDINAAMTAAGFPASVSASFVGGAFHLSDSSDTYGVVMGNDTADTVAKMQINPLFSVVPGQSSAQSVKVVDKIANDPNQIAAARMSADGSVSLNDNTNAIALAGLATDKFNFGAAGGLSAQSSAIPDYMNTIVSALAINLNDYSTKSDYNQTLMSDITTRQQSVSGVNMDEELTNLIVYQRSYQASARVINTVDTLFDSLMNAI